MKGHRGAVAYCVRADARRSWPSWLAIGLLVGLAAGAVMAAAAGARRTESAYQDLRTETNAMDAAIAFGCNPAIDDACPATIEDIRALPGIQEAARFESSIVPILDADGRLVQITDDPCASGNGAIDVTAAVDPAFGTTLQGIRIVEGRAADPSRADEVVMSPLAAEQLGIEVGDRLFPHLVDCGLERAQRGEPTPVTVVGLGLTTFEVPPKNGFYVQSIHTTPAFAALPAWRALKAEDESPPLIGVRLDDGVDVDGLRETAGTPSLVVVLDLEREFTRAVDEGLQGDANALWLVALLGGVASVFVLGPTLTRYRGDAAAIDENLAALGWSRRDRVGRSALHGVAIGVLAVTVAVVIMLLVSTRTPDRGRPHHRARARRRARRDGGPPGWPRDHRPRDGDARRPVTPIAEPCSLGASDAPRPPRQPDGAPGPGRARDPHRPRAGTGPGPRAVLGLRRGPRRHCHHRRPRLHQQRPAPS